MDFTDIELSTIFTAFEKSNDNSILPFLDEEARNDYSKRDRGDIFTELPIEHMLKTYQGRQELLRGLQSPGVASSVAIVSYLKLLCRYKYISKEILDQILGVIDVIPTRDEKRKAFLRNLLEFPYGLIREMETDINRVTRKIDDQLFGMRRAKDAILEFITLLFYSGSPRPTSIILSGPPGVGKTSFAYAVAHALNLPTIKISFAGTFDTAVLTGMQFGWSSSTPGIIFKEFIRVRCSNPVVVCDEIDKSGGASTGKVEYILAELLNPAQSSEYKDNYMGFAVDLSRAFYICTCNELHCVPNYIRDRCHIVEIEEYNRDERFMIIKKYLPAQLREDYDLAFDLEVSDEVAECLSRGLSLREAKRRMLSLAARKLKEGDRPGERLRIDCYDEALFGGTGIRQPIGFMR